MATKENQEFARPYTYEQRPCRGRHCAKCGLCRDWYYTGDSESWKWIQNCRNWETADWQRYRNDGAWKLFRLRDDGATCRHHDYDADHPHYGLCVCEDNIRSVF